MNLFRKTSSEPAPAPCLAPSMQPDAITAALAEETAAAVQVAEHSATCMRLDQEQRSWQDRRNAAYVGFCESLARHADAKAQLERLSKPQVA